MEGFLSFLLGLRSSKAPAMYAGYLLEQFYPNVSHLSQESDFVYDRASRLSEQDVVLLIVNAPYTNLSVDIARFLHERGVPVLLVTDDPTCPATSYSDIVLPTKSSERQYAIIPTVTVLESLVIEFGRHQPDSSISYHDDLGKVLRDNDITS